MDSDGIEFIQAAARGDMVPKPYLPMPDDPSLGTFMVPEGWTVETIDEQAFLANPRRPRAVVSVSNAGSFATAVKERLNADDGQPVVYAEESRSTLVAIINDDHGDTDTVGWRDHRVSLDLIETPEWRHWTAREGLHPQDYFAETIDDGLEEIVRPDAATMLEIAQLFDAQTKASFKQARRLSSGAIQIGYEEEIDATAGNVTIPEEFVLLLAPFVGVEKVEMVAKLRYTLRGGELKIGYKLVRPHEVKAEAFKAQVVAATELLGDAIVLVDGGTAPAARS